jgi:hypothetical protein
MSWKAKGVGVSMRENSGGAIRRGCGTRKGSAVAGWFLLGSREKLRVST